jgi:hypothetical protein
MKKQTVDGNPKAPHKVTKHGDIVKNPVKYPESPAVPDVLPNVVPDKPTASHDGVSTVDLT